MVSHWLLEGDNLGWTANVALGLVVLFFVPLFRLIIHKPNIFTKRHGRKHAVTGLLYLVWITLGFLDLISQELSRYYNSYHYEYNHQHQISMNISSEAIASHQPLVPYVLFDAVLGVLGTMLTLFAAVEFQHKNVKNEASGTLDERATVTYNEMIEHSFYQALNLVQILFIHSMGLFSGSISSSSVSLHQHDQSNHVNNNTISSDVFTSYVAWKDLPYRLALLFIVTSPWLIRQRFPIHKFSDNYKNNSNNKNNKVNEDGSNFAGLIRILYRLKKYQYVFYKHFLLHGLNITIAITGIAFGNEFLFRLYWLLLNTSYVMEFFLQTLVKKRFMPQSHMLSLQKVLMTASSIAALMILRHVNVHISLASMLGNFTFRKHDLFNTMFIATSYVALCYYVMPDRILL